MVNQKDNNVNTDGGAHIMRIPFYRRRACPYCGQVNIPERSNSIYCSVLCHQAGEEQVAILLRGVEGWNQWCTRNREIRPQLSGIDLRGEILRGAYLFDANLGSANLDQADLGNANLSRANLDNANLNSHGKRHIQGVK